MKLFAILVLATVLSVGLFATTEWKTATADRDPFIGAWEGTDLVDGSNMKLSIGGGNGDVHRVSWREDYWTTCAGDPGIGIGAWTFDEGNSLSGDIVIRCPRAGTTTSIPITVTYDASSDTLESQYGEIWHRR